MEKTAVNLNPDATIGVVGVCGINGNLIARILAEHGYKVIVNDIVSKEKCRFRDALKGYSFYEEYYGHLPDEFFEKIDYIVLPLALVENNSEIYQKALKENIKLLQVEDILNIFEPARPVICVTGTNGKTTTTNIIKSLAYYSNKKPCEHNLEGMQGNAGDIPALQSRLKGDLNILETGTFGIKGSLTKLAKPCKPDVGIITNITPDHLDENSTFLDYARVKGELIALLNNKTLIANNDDPTVMSLIRELNYEGNLITFGIEHKSIRRDTKQCICGEQIIVDEIIAGVGKYECSCGNKYRKPDYIAADINDSHNRFTLVTPYGEEVRFTLQINGIHNIYNALGSIIVAHEILDMSYDDIKQPLMSFTGVKGRMEKIGKIADKQVMVDYAHNPAGITTVLKELKNLYDTVVNVITTSSESGITGDMEILERAVEYADYVVPASHNAFICAKKACDEGQFRDKIVLPENMPEGDKKGTLGATIEQVMTGFNKAKGIDADLLVLTGEAAFKFKDYLIDEIKNSS